MLVFETWWWLMRLSLGPPPPHMPSPSGKKGDPRAGAWERARDITRVDATCDEGPTQGTHTGDPHRGPTQRGPTQGARTGDPHRGPTQRGGPHRGPTTGGEGHTGDPHRTHTDNPLSFVASGRATGELWPRAAGEPPCWNLVGRVPH